MILGELALGIYILLTLMILLPVVGPVLWPWSLTSAFGFFVVAIVSLAENLARWRKLRKRSPQVEVE